MDIKTITVAFNDAGKELYLVGGCVRDELLQRPVHDYDFCTNAKPEETFTILSKFGHPHRVGEKFGTIGLGDIEITTYRAETYRNQSRHPEVVFGDSIEFDLARRDFTINAIAKNVVTGEIVDPYGGQRDLDIGTLRCVGNADDRFSEDPLRILRAIRFAYTFGLIIENKTQRAIQNKAASLLNISQERIQEEFSKILVKDYPSFAINALFENGLIPYIAPELYLLKDPRTQGVYHKKSVYPHTLDVVDKTPNDLIVRLAALFHDIGKMPTRSEQNGKVHFYGHEAVGTIIAESVLRRLRFSNEIVDRVTKLVTHHMDVNFYRNSWKDGTVRRLMERLGDDMENAIALARADQASHVAYGDYFIEDLVGRIEKLKNERPEGLSKLPIDGDDLMERYNRPPGAWIKELKEALTNAVLDGTIEPDDRDGAFGITDGIVHETASTS